MSNQRDPIEEWADVIASSPHLLSKPPSPPPQLVFHTDQHGKAHLNVPLEPVDLDEYNTEQVENIDVPEDALVLIYDGAVVGYVRHISHEGHDFTPALDARMSTKRELRTPTEDLYFTESLLCMGHTSPFEMPSLRLEICCPLFVRDHLVRHRHFSLNVFSQRYSNPIPGGYVPPISRPMSKGGANHQMSVTGSASPGIVRQELFAFMEEVADYTQSLAEEGASSEMIRFCSPPNGWTKLVYKSEIINWARFLKLRTKSAAQIETQIIAEACGYILYKKFPLLTPHLYNYIVNAESMSSEMVDAMQVALEEIEEHYGRGAAIGPLHRAANQFIPHKGARIRFFRRLGVFDEVKRYAKSLRESRSPEQQ